MTRALTAAGAPAAAATPTQSAGPVSREDCDLFYRNTAPALRAYLRRMTGVDADDLLQDAYVRFLTAPRAALTEPRAYLYRIATRLVLDVPMAKRGDGRALPSDQLSLLARFR